MRKRIFVEIIAWLIIIVGAVYGMILVKHWRDTNFKLIELWQKRTEVSGKK